MVGLPASIIKKYGVTKKAWAVYRRSKHKTASGKKWSYPHRNTGRKLRKHKQGKTFRHSKTHTHRRKKEFGGILF